MLTSHYWLYGVFLWCKGKPASLRRTAALETVIRQLATELIDVLWFISSVEIDGNHLHVKAFSALCHLEAEYPPIPIIPSINPPISINGSLARRSVSRFRFCR